MNHSSLGRRAGRGALLLAALLAALLLSPGEARAQEDCPEGERRQKPKSTIIIHGKVVGTVESCVPTEVTVGETGTVEPSEHNDPDEPLIKGETVDLTVRVRDDEADLEAALRERVGGSVEGAETVKIELVDEEGNITDRATFEVEDQDEPLDLSTLDLSVFSCVRARDRRCEIYEALPSVLLGMNGMLSHEERMSAPRSPRGVWARAEGATATGRRTPRRRA